MRNVVLRSGRDSIKEPLNGRLIYCAAESCIDFRWQSGLPGRGHQNVPFFDSL